MAPQVSPKLDLSIEGMRSQQFSEAVFAFLLIGIVVFSVIVVVFWFSKNRPQEVKRGEKIMFAGIVMGVAVAVVFGALQMLGGVLF
jgi:branched-subunit amino acid permease